jgi:hypothetical protein
MWSLTSLQQQLVKTGGRLIKHARYYWLLLAESQSLRRNVWLFSGGYVCREPCRTRQRAVEGLGSKLRAKGIFGYHPVLPRMVMPYRKSPSFAIGMELDARRRSRSKLSMTRESQCRPRTLPELASGSRERSAGAPPLRRGFTKTLGFGFLDALNANHPVGCVECAAHLYPLTFEFAGGFLVI